MLQALDSAWQHLNDPARFGGVIDQFPATAAALGLLLVVALLCGGGKSHALRFAAVLVFALGALAAAGQRVTPAEGEPLWLTHLGWISLAAPASLLLISATPAVPLRIIALLLALAVSVAVSGVVGYALAEWGGAGEATPQAPDSEPETAAPDTPESVPAPEPESAPSEPQDNIFEFGRE